MTSLSFSIIPPLFLCFFIFNPVLADNKQNQQTDPTPTKTLSDFWKLSVSKNVLDPAKWDSVFKTRLFLTLVVFLAARYVGVKTFQAMGAALFAYGAVHLSWGLAGSLAAIAYGYKRAQPLFLGAGILCSYIYFLGSDLSILNV